MSQSTELPGQVATLAQEAAPPQVARRATQLCLRAEPHTDQAPCSAHLSEAQRQLFQLGG